MDDGLKNPGTRLDERRASSSPGVPVMERDYISICFFDDGDEIVPI